MKLTVGQLRQIVQEERARLHEGFYPGQFAGMDPDDIVDLVSASERRGTKIKVSKRDLEHLHPEDAQWVLDSLKEPFSLVNDVPPTEEAEPPRMHSATRGKNPWGSWRPPGKPGSGRWRD